jgi:hypothetical protein
LVTAQKGSTLAAGANENTTIELTTDVKIEGHELVAGGMDFL